MDKLRKRPGREILEAFDQQFGTQIREDFQKLRT